MHAVNNEGFLRNPSSTEYVSAANISSFFPKLSTSQLMRQMELEGVVLIDARFEKDYQHSHIENAINVPVSATPAQRHAILKNVGHQQPIIIYCQSLGCRFDEKVAILLARDGFGDISLYPGGWREWRDAGRVE